MNFDKEVKKQLEDCEEYFFICKIDGTFKSIHSNLTNPFEWLDMMQYFKQKLENKVIDSNPSDDLLDDTNFNLN